MSRRRRRDTHRFFIVGGLLIAAGMLIFFRGRGPVKLVERAVYKSSAPLVRIIMRVQGRLRCGIYGVCGDEELGHAAAQKTSAFETEKLHEENETLRQLLKLSEGERSVVVAAIIFYGREAGKEFFILGEGQERGIAEGDVVMDGESRIAGIVREAGRKYAKVNVASNPGETFEAVLIPLRVKVLARGLGARTFSIDLLPQGTPVRKGDFVALLSGSAPGRSLLAQVSSLESRASGTFQNIRAVLAAQPEFLTHAAVVVKSTAAKE